MSGENQEQIARLRELLDTEITRQLGQSSYGCWPLLVALAGMILGIVLLVSGRS